MIPFMSRYRLSKQKSVEEKEDESLVEQPRPFSTTIDGYFFESQRKKAGTPMIPGSVCVWCQ